MAEVQASWEVFLDDFHFKNHVSMGVIKLSVHSDPAPSTFVCGSIFRDILGLCPLSSSGSQGYRRYCNVRWGGGEMFS